MMQVCKIETIHNFVKKILHNHKISHILCKKSINYYTNSNRFSFFIMTGKSPLP